ncbi:hypothetical protein [Thermogladius sp.]|uniref:hypothetical protein n=1 Tax=Thermogladius sp. TaxID=2023064 RepID=UPI003D135E7E
MDLLYLAYYLSVLTYFIGAALKGLPLPLASVKKVGQRLMVDGVFSAFMVFSYKALVFSISYFSSVIGADWRLLNEWYIAESASLMSLFVLLKTIGFLYSKVGLGFLASGLISPMVSLLVDVLVTITVFYLAVKAIYLTAKTMIAVGILLYSIPFRLTRPAGAVLISLPIVFTVGAPLLPNFVAMFSTFNPPDNFVQAQPAYIRLLDYLNQPIAYFVVNASDANGNQLYMYLSDSSGLVNATSMERWIPLGYQRLDFLMPGSKYSEEANVTSSGGVVNLTYRVPNIIKIDVNTLVYYNTDEAVVESVERSNNTFTTLFNVLYSTKIYLVYESSSTLIVWLDNTTAQGYTVSFDWFNVGFKALVLSLHPGLHNLTIQVINVAASRPNVSEVYYFEKVVESGSTLSLAIGLVSIKFFTLLVLPVVYIFVLVTATLGLARILGGVEARISRLLVLGP